jgi:tetratricopeptide (TPR) repeat protein
MRGEPAGSWSGGAADAVTSSGRVPARAGRLLAPLLVVLAALGSGPAELSAQARTREEVRRAAEDRAADRVLARAEQALRAGRRGRALSLLEASARRLPRDARAALRLCDLLVPETDETIEAVLAGADAEAARCQASLALVTPDPGSALDARIEASLAWARALGGDRGPALARLASRPLDERDVPALLRLAALAVRAGALEDADTALSLARRVRPNDLALTADLGAVRLALGDAASAVTLLRSVVAGHPDDREALHDLAGACLQAGEHAAAVRYLGQLAQAEPEEPERWIDLARARIELGAFDAAAEDARRAVVLSRSDDARASLALGDALRLGGDPGGARAAYEEALRREPRSVRARHALDALDRSL